MSDVTPMHPESRRHARNEIHDGARGSHRPRSRPSGGAGPLRSRQRARFLRRRLRRRHEEPQVARDRREGPADPAAISTIAAPSAPIPRSATAAASWCRSRTTSSPRNARSSASSCPSPAITPSATSSCRAIRKAARMRRGHRRRSRSPTRAWSSLGWRDVPVDIRAISARRVKADEPLHRADLHRPRPDDRDAGRRSSGGSSSPRKVISNAVYDSSDARDGGLSTRSRCPSRTIVYKGMVLVTQLGAYYLDLTDARFDERPGARAPALRDQHLPVLAARASLSHGRA